MGECVSVWERGERERGCARMREGVFPNKMRSNSRLLVLCRKRQEQRLKSLPWLFQTLGGLWTWRKCCSCQCRGARTNQIVQDRILLYNIQQNLQVAPKLGPPLSKFKIIWADWRKSHKKVLKDRVQHLNKAPGLIWSNVMIQIWVELGANPINNFLHVTWDVT